MTPENKYTLKFFIDNDRIQGCRNQGALAPTFFYRMANFTGFTRTYHDISDQAPSISILLSWRYDTILNILAMTFQSVRYSIIYVDLPGFISPSAITGNNLPPDLLVLPNKCLYILELTVGFESNIRKNSHRKHKKCYDLVRQQEHLFSEVYQLINQHSWGTLSTLIGIPGHASGSELQLQH